MALEAGTPTHRAKVRVYDGEMIEADQLVRYVGPPSWKFEPLDAVSAARWSSETADPQRVLKENLRTNVVLRPPMSDAEELREAEIRRSRGQPIRIS